jgi:hypothetical protein
MVEMMVVLMVDLMVALRVVLMADQKVVLMVGLMAFGINVPHPHISRYIVHGSLLYSNKRHS